MRHARMHIEHQLHACEELLKQRHLIGPQHYCTTWATTSNLTIDYVNASCSIAYWTPTTCMCCMHHLWTTQTTPTHQPTTLLYSLSKNLKPHSAFHGIIGLSTQISMISRGAAVPECRVTASFIVRSSSGWSLFSAVVETVLVIFKNRMTASDKIFNFKSKDVLHAVFRPSERSVFADLDHTSPRATYVAGRC